MVWAEAALSPATAITYADFLTELQGAVEAAYYRYTPHHTPDGILVAGVTSARGLSFDTVAILGLAEGEFPATLSEDPLLRNHDRRRLQRVGLDLPMPTDSVVIGQDKRQFLNV